MNLEPLYGLVREDLAEVERLLADTRRIADFPEMESRLGQVLDGRGKRLRPLVALLAGRLGEKRAPSVVPLAAAVELLHTATLIHDDVIDSAGTRRGRPTANALFDNRSAVVLGDYLLASAAELVTRTENVRVMQVFTYALKTLVSGELRQDLRAFDYGQTRDDYLRRITDKTASLFAASASGAAIVSGEALLVEPMWAYGEALGIAFQIVDDVLDFFGTEDEMGKPVASDLLHGTLTLPALLLMERRKEDNPIEEFFKNPARTDLVGEAVRLIREPGILDEARSTAESYGAKARQALASLPESEARRGLEDLIDFALARRA